MAALVTRKFGSYTEVNQFLRGDILSGPLSEAAPVISPTVLYGLDGKTLVFTTPAVTVTFSDTTHKGLLISEVVAQIQAALGGGYVVGAFERRLRIEKAAPGVLVLAGTGTANAKLGFQSITTTSIKYAAPDGAAPRFVWLSSVGVGEAVIVVTEE